MRKLWYMGLEPYEGRYTLQLQQWSEEVFKHRKIDYRIVDGELLEDSKSIITGQVLDAHGRSYFSLTQMAELVKHLKYGHINSEDVIFFEDMFTPGIEALPYIFNQIPKEYRPKVFVRCLAQTIDPDDFVHVWNMSKWMRNYEELVSNFVTGILASNEEMVANLKIAGFTAPIYNISGLAFSKNEVQSRVTTKPFNERKKRVVFAARFDQEKQPNFYMDLVRKADPSIEFAVLSGGELKSNNDKYILEAKSLEKTHNFKIYENLKKNEYYKILADSRILFNCALQDWTSNTLSEADALGTNVLFPAYRSFPEIFNNDYTRLYVPWSIDDALNKLYILLDNPHHNIGKISDWTSETIDRCLDIMDGLGEHWARNDVEYRNHVSENKY